MYNNNHNANALSPLELRLETIKSLDNFEYKLLKCFYNGRSILENYLKRENVLHVHGLVGNKGFCATYLRADNNRAIHNGKSSVFVGIGDISKPSRPLATIERLQPLDSCDVFRANSSEKFTFPFSFDTTDSAVKCFWRVLDWKLRSLYILLGIEAGQRINEVIKSGSEVIDYFADKNAELLRHGDWTTSDIADINELIPFNRAPYTLVINRNTIYLILAKGLNPSFQVTEVFTCPIDPLISAIQRVHMLYYHCGGESGKEAKDTKRISGTPYLISKIMSPPQLHQEICMVSP